MTLRAALRRYEEKTTTTHRGSKKEASHIAVLCDEPLSNRSLAPIERANIRALSDRWATALAIATVNRTLTILHAVFATAMRDWGVRGIENPVDGMKLKGATERARRVSEQEIEAICRAAIAPFLPAFVRLAVGTAMRRGELCDLTWAMVDLEKRTVSLPGSVTKSGKPHGLPLSPRAVECLRRIERNGELVFQQNGPTVTQSFKRAVARARVLYGGMQSGGQGSCTGVPGGPTFSRPSTQSHLAACQGVRPA